MKIAFLFPARALSTRAWPRSSSNTSTESKEVFDSASRRTRLSTLRTVHARPCREAEPHGEHPACDPRCEHRHPDAPRAEGAFGIGGSRPQPRRVYGNNGGGRFRLQGRGFTGPEARQYMQEAVPEGTGLMAAILGMDRQDVEKTCLEASKNGIVAPANYNTPGQIVIAGEKKAVEKAMELAKVRGSKKSRPACGQRAITLLLDDNRPESGLSRELENVTISDLRVPIVNNADAKFLSKASELRPSLIRQISSPLFWEDSITAMVAGRLRHLHRDRPGQGALGPGEADRQGRPGAERGRSKEHERYAQRSRIITTGSGA